MATSDEERHLLEKNGDEGKQGRSNASLRCSHSDIVRNYLVVKREESTVACRCQHVRMMYIRLNKRGGHDKQAWSGITHRMKR